MIPPPYPFPKQWKRVAETQAFTNERFWMVPPDELPVSVSIAGPVLPQSNTIPAAEDVNADDGEGGEYYEELVVNPAWAERLAPTVVRLERKRSSNHNSSKRKRSKY